MNTCVRVLPFFINLLSPERQIVRTPSLSKISNPKSGYPNVDKPIFFRKLIRLIYKWWAYLPLWTGLLVNFKERHANDVELESTHLHSPMRFSNALIESYFRRMKHITLERKRYCRPDVIIERLLDALEQQLKAGKFGVTRGAKGRMRKKHGERKLPLGRGEVSISISSIRSNRDNLERRCKMTR